ncbi:unnamed protein product, partial [Cyprideis torosa]
MKNQRLKPPCGVASAKRVLHWLAGASVTVNTEPLGRKPSEMTNLGLEGETDYYPTTFSCFLPLPPSLFQYTTHSRASLPENLTTSLSLLVSDDSSTADDSSPPVGVFATMSIRGGLLPDGEIIGCHRESSMLFLLLMLGTVWVGVSLYNFNKTPYLQASKREALADYALPVAVLLLSFVGSYIFISVPWPVSPPFVPQGKKEVVSLSSFVASSSERQ